MLILIKTLLIIGLLFIFYQDIKERKVYTLLLILVCFGFGFLHFDKIPLQQFLMTVTINLIVVLIIIFILFLYSKIKLKLPLGQTFGMGDLLFFFAIAVGFPTITFSVLFTFSLIFSLILFLVFKKELNDSSVPLAGLQSLFFTIIFLLNWTSDFVNLYQY